MPLFPIVKRIAPSGTEASPNLYLTFDDGPDPMTTPAVLRLLSDAGMKATFFVIAKQAKQYPSLLREIVAAGHSIGNHSWDHTWVSFFQVRARMHAWVRRAEGELHVLTSCHSVGFRSPAGVVTPPLIEALRYARLPLIGWATRFYDAVIPFSQAAVAKSWLHTRPGDIVLLHDRQHQDRRAAFLETLAYYLATMREKGYGSLALHSQLPELQAWPTQPSCLDFLVRSFEREPGGLPQPVSGGFSTHTRHSPTP